jgi:HYR domain-containing protein
MRRFLPAAVVVFAFLGAVAAAAPPAIRVDDNITAEATSAAGANVTYHVKAYDPDSGNAIGASCSPGGRGTGDFDVSADFPLGTTPVHCEATLEDGSVATKDTTVTVQDTTAPAFAQPPTVNESTTDPSGKDVSYTSPTATDAVAGSIVGSCNPASGTHFPVGTTTVTCTASDGTNTGSTSFAVVVTLVDNEPPTLTVPPDQVREATGPGGAVVTFSVTASENADTNCDHASGSTFPIAKTTVTCVATDGSGNSSAPGSFDVTVQDTTKPSLALPGNQSVETSDPGGATVSFSATASDSVDGSIGVSCNPPSGSTFPVGTTTVNCSATDSHGNSTSGSFAVTVALVDHIAPTFSGVPGTIQREANGPLGSNVTYALPTATDNLDSGPLLVTCAPASGTTFPLGTTTVSCSATDTHLNTGVATFAVVVVDTTPPVLTPPGDRNVYATTPTGIPRDDPAVGPFVNGAVASDIVDPAPAVGSDAGQFFPLGTTTVTFVATDHSGNTSHGTSTITVFPMPPAGTTPPPLPQPPDRTPPDDVKNLTATAGSRRVTLTWARPSASDFDHVVVTRSLADGGDVTQRYTGKALTFVDTPVQNGVEYRYTVVAYDTGGNRSAGAVVTATPKQSLLLTPRDGARVKATKKGLKVSWARMQGADYYNLQLYRVPGSTDVKVLTVWPKKPSFVLKQAWKFSGVRYRLRPGVYRWYVWPGYGPRVEVDYGPMLGSSTFVVTR